MYLQRIQKTKTMPHMTQRRGNLTSQRSINSRSVEPTGDTENGCVTLGGQSGAPGCMIGEAITMPVDEEEEANRLIDQVLDLQKTLHDLTSRMDDAGKFPLSGLI